MTKTRRPFGQRTVPRTMIRHRPTGWLLSPIPGVVTLFGTPDPAARRALMPTPPAA